ncbi:BolA family transcriptional regulator [Ramlibacter sp. AW1]|uniref:BolA family transcriptional regulator n=1 Tax=Ramlibacter aurantiacus TaxID=2801330 RepID=A0A937D4E9_9BURK|nr:BolA family protein [Ramlibacter aurantiacus]MBL0418823.1 BolA family transcriptional regulator [Ramlibacter aurantiacus]
MSGTGITAEAIRLRLQEALQPTALEVIDESHAHAGHAGADGTGFGTHFRVRISAPAFVGRAKVAQHRLVYDALRSFIDRGLHALALETSPSASPESSRNPP